MAKVKILIVDDDHTTSSIMELLVKNAGYKVVGIASSAKEAIDAARDLEPDLVLMDIMLGDGADGIDSALVISKHMNIAIVFVTAYSDQRTLRRVRNVKPKGFINKPLRELDIKTTIELAINTKAKNIIYQDIENLSAQEALQNIYTLTRSESKVVVSLMQFPDLDTTASILDRSISTIRTHLKRIYKKTNTHSKAELIHELRTGPMASWLANKNITIKDAL